MTQPLFYKDFLSAQSKPVTEKTLGRKGVSLAHLVQNKIPVPPFFIIPADWYSKFVARIFKDKQVSSLEDFRKSISSLTLDEETKALIAAEYGKLSGFGKAWVAARSSVVATSHEQTSFSGLLASKLNIRGSQEIEAALKEVYLSLFTDRTYDYLKRNKISYGDVSTAVIIQKMIQAEVSGIMYTYDPITNNPSHVSIEAVFGLGDVLAEGSVNPDIYTVSKESLDIVEKKIVPQEWMKVRKMGDANELEHLQKITISQMWQYSQKLDDMLIRELTKLADVVEKSFGEPQIIEWAMERGSLYILQAKPLSHASENTFQKVQEVSRKVTTASDLDSFSKIADSTPLIITKDTKPEKPAPVLPPETLLFTGIAAGTGVAYGEALLLPNAESISGEALAHLQSTISKRHILFVNEFTATLEPLFALAGGVVSNFGGANSDVGLLTRSANIPAVVGTRIGTTYVQSGTLLKIDGSSGAVYRVDFLPEELPEQPVKRILRKKKKKKTAAKTAVSTPVKEMPPAPAPVPAPPPTKTESTPETTTITKKAKKNFPIKLFLRDTDISNFTFTVSLDDAKQFPDAELLIVPVLDTKKSTILSIKKLKKQLNGTLVLLLPVTGSFDEVLATKRALSALGIRRSKKIHMVVAFSTLYGVMNSKSVSDLSVDGVFFAMQDLATAFKPGATEIDPELWQLVERTVESLKKQKWSYLGITLDKPYFTVPLRKEMKPVVKKGVNVLVFVESLPSVTAEDVEKIGEEVVGVQLG